MKIFAITLTLSESDDINELILITFRRIQAIEKTRLAIWEKSAKKTKDKFFSRLQQEFVPPIKPTRTQDDDLQSETETLEDQLHVQQASLSSNDIDQCAVSIQCNFISASGFLVVAYRR